MPCLASCCPNYLRDLLLGSSFDGGSLLNKDDLPENEQEIKVPDTIEEVVQPLDTSFLEVVRSVQSELEVHLERLLETKKIEATPKQYGAIALLSSGISDSQTAEIMDMSRVTVWRIKTDPRFEPLIKELRTVFARRIFQWSMGLLPWAFRAMYDNLKLGDLDQRRLTAQAVFKLVGEQLTSGAMPPEEPPPPRAEEGVLDLFD